jgi:succinate-semialdehyde dehydrogenase/glutarate-semialdehyde dehydrogenase
MIISVDPWTGETLRSFQEYSGQEISDALDAAVAAQSEWRYVGVDVRVQLLRNLASVLRANKSDLAGLITLEMGKPITESEAEIEKCAYNCDHYAEAAPRYLAPEIIQSTATTSAVEFEPLGVVLAIMPWNYPFWQLFRFAAPAFAAGNGIILKHANNVPQCALAIEEAVSQAGALNGLFRTLLIDNAQVASLISDERIAAVTLTGSTQVGALVAAQAGQALKKQVLELGGSDPFIVLADADIGIAAQAAVKARFTNVGQSCVNAKRFIVDQSVADKFVDAFVEEARKLRIGDPRDPATNIGPMAREDLRRNLHDQVQRTVSAGAVVRLGGRGVDGPGFTYEPTIIDNVDPSMAAFCEETFGPVAAIIRSSNTEESIRLANQTEFGLAASIWTSDVRAARELCRRIDAGAVFINGVVMSDPRLPFGGIKKSGYGRELGSYGIREFTNVKTVWIGAAS